MGRVERVAASLSCLSRAMQFHGGVRPSTVRLCLLVTFYFLFLVGGAAIFSEIEAPDEAGRIKALRDHRARFLQQNYCVHGESLHFIK